ncbi:MAG: pilus assembly protein PilM [Candidatus Omnitrophica bacterium]|nr:pilus assembly protein PilM [Candidatus Omnitrophota bacterium]
MIGGIKSFINNIKIPRFPRNMKFMKFDFKAGAVAVEIGNDWLKISQKSPARGNEFIYQISLTKLAEIKGGVALAIDDIFKDLKLDRQHVVAYIPRHLVTVRMLDLPATDPKEINDMINLQVGKQTPYSKEEIVSSHKIIEIGAAGYAKVMLVIAARNIINERTDTLVKAGLDIKRVAISSEGVFNWFTTIHMPRLKLDDSQGVVVVDIDSNYSDFIVIRRGKMVFTRNIFIGANHLMQDSDEWRDKFAEELKRSFERHQSEEKNVKIVKMFLSGAGANIKGLDIVLSAGIGLPIEGIDQLSDIRARNSIEALRAENFRYVSLTQLLGVSMTDKEPQIDLTTGEQKVQHLMDTKRKQLTVMGILIASIVTMLSFLCLTDIYNKNAYLSKLKRMATKIGADADDIEKMRAVISLVEKRLDSRGSSIEVINEIYKITPKEIYLTDINIDEKQTVVLKGGGLAMSDVFKYVKKLEESDMLENVKTTYTTTKKDKDTEFAEFEISCTYQK